MNELVERIANRHIARCLSRIDQVHALPELCAEAIRNEMHFCAADVVEAYTKQEDKNGNTISSR